MGTTEVGYLAVTPLVYSEQQTTSIGNSSTNNTALNGNKTKHNDRREILVLRGWVPASWKTSASSGNIPCPPNAAMTTTVQGVVRFGEDPGTFVPDNKPEEGTWFYLNSEQLADAVGLPRGTPLVEVISDSEQVKMLETGPTVLDVLGGRGKLPPAPEEVYPLAKSEGDMGAFSVMPRDHLNYAATWFTLMAATGGMAIKALRKGKRG
jgi:surfeit locus 1 family protein